MVAEYDSVAAVYAASNKRDPRRLHFCYRLATDAASAELGNMVIGRVNSGPKRIWHAVVKLADGSIFDGVDQVLWTGQPSVDSQLPLSA